MKGAGNETNNKRNNKFVFFLYKSFVGSFRFSGVLNYARGRDNINTIEQNNITFRFRSYFLFFLFEPFRFLGVLNYERGRNKQNKQTELCLFQFCFFCCSVYEIFWFLGLLNYERGGTTQNDYITTRTTILFFLYF